MDHGEKTFTIKNCLIFDRKMVVVAEGGEGERTGVSGESTLLENQ